MRRIPPRLESYTENKSVQYACGKGKKDKGQGCIHYKLNGLGKMAKPDQLFVTPNGYDLFVEFKREGEEPTRLQEIEAGYLIKRHQIHAFVWTFEQFKTLLHNVLQLPPRLAPILCKR